MINHELIAATVADTPVYRVQRFNMSELSGFADDGQLNNTFTPAVMVTGSPDAIANPDDADNQRALLSKVKAAPDSAFLPKDGRLARLMFGSRDVPSTELKKMLVAYDVAKKRAEYPAP